MTRARIQLLGDVTLTGPSGDRLVVRGSQTRSVMTLFVLARSRVVSRSEVAELLWGEQLPSHWAGAVRGVVTKVRTALRSAGMQDWLDRVADGWLLDLGDRADVDLFRAEELTAEAERLQGGGDTGGAAGLAERAEELLGAELAPGAAGEAIEAARADAEVLARRAATVLVESLLARGGAGAAVGPARRLLARAPYDEMAARLAARAVAAAGDRHGAVQLLEDFQTRLEADLDARPGADTRSLLASLRRGQAAGAGRAGGGPPRVRTPLFGRTRERDELAACWGEVLSSASGRCVTITGEPGCGKTRLAVEAVRLAQARDAAVLWVGCNPVRTSSLGVALDLVTQLAERSPEALASLGPQRGSISFLLGAGRTAPTDAPGMSPAESMPGAGDPGPSIAPPGPADRAILFRAVAGLFTAAVRSPTVLVVDDLQWADEDSLDLLVHLVDVMAAAPVLSVVTARDHGAGVAGFVEHATRVLGGETIELRGLDEQAIAQMLSDSGVADAAALAPPVMVRTGGNPFFITQLLAQRKASGEIDLHAVPRTLSAWLDQRIEVLEPETAQVLETAAVIGQSVEVASLAAVTGRDRVAVAEACDRLIRANLLMEDRDRVQFAHALTREAVLGRMSRTLRAELHGRCADVLADEGVGTVAYHLLRAGSDRSVEAVEAALGAADEALTGAAWAEAGQWCREVLRSDAADPHRRAAALVRYGHSLRGLGDRVSARAAFEEAIAIAAEHGDGRTVAEATLGLVGGGARGVADDMADAERAQLLEQALGGLRDADDDLRIPLQLELALALLLTDEVDRRDQLTAEAVARARRSRDSDLLGRALLSSRLSLLNPSRAPDRLRLSGEVLALASPSRSTGVTLQALLCRHEDLLLIGDRHRAREALAEAADLADRYDHPYWRWAVTTWEALDSIIDGDLQGAEARALAALAYQAEHPEAVACLGVNLVDIRLYSGRASEVVDLLAAAADENPNIPCYRAVLALCLAESADLAGAREQYDVFADVGFSNLPRDTNWLLGIAVLADVAATLADRSGAAVLLDELEPHRDLQVVLNCYAGGGAYWGPVSTQIARLLALVGDERAGQVAAEAVAAADAMGSPLAAERARRALSV